MAFTRIFELIEFQQKRYPSKKAFNQKILGRWERRSTEQFIERRDELSLGLLNYGFEKQSNVGIFCSFGSTEWLIIDTACMQIGMISVPINPNYTDEELKLILTEVNMELCFVNEDLLADRLIACGLEKSKIISFGNSIRHKSWSEIKVSPNQGGAEIIQEKRNQVKENDLATIIYTSGSTGNPKGVMLSHWNIISNIKSIISLIPVNYKHKVASYLPLSHVFERMVLYTYISIGANIYFIQSPKVLLKELAHIKPHYITSVPRILENVYNGIRQNVKQGNAINRFIVNYALNTGKRKSSSFFGKFTNNVQIKLADILVYRRWRKVLGGQIKGVIVGAASMQEDIARLYSRAGIPVKEGYGLTETSPVVAFNRFEPGGTKYGTVGIPIPGVEVKILSELDHKKGEVLVRGPNVMVGYYKNETLTNEKIDSEGWFHTGDIGEFVDNRFLKITDRKKNIYKTSSGLYVFPQKIEDDLRKHEYIDQCLTVGFQKPFISALIIPNFTALKKWCKYQGIHWTAPLYMVENDRVKEFYEMQINTINANLKSHEQIKKNTLLASEWSIDTGEYTPTLKLRRDVILEKYAKEIDKMYSSV